MLAKQPTRSNCGQAIVELMPAIMIFTLVVSAGMAYFRVMRAAARNEEASRNIAFAKINNSGTLTTLDSNSARPLTLGIEGSPQQVAQSGKNDFIDERASCIVVSPDGSAPHQVPVEISGLAQVSTMVSFSTQSVICRKPQ